MKYYFFSSIDGRGLGHIDTKNPDAVIENTPTDSIIVEGDFPDNCYLHEGVVHTFPIRPNKTHHFNWTTKQWEDPRALQDLKDARKVYVNTSRATANTTSFPFAGYTIATDALSRSDIDGVNGEVANTGALPQGWPGGWKTLENTYVSIPDVATWKTFYTAMVNQGSFNFGKAQTLKAAIDAATTVEEVEAIVW